MKKKLITVCVALLILALLSACNSQESSSKKEMSGYIHENGSAEVILADEKTAQSQKKAEDIFPCLLSFSDFLDY